MLKCKLDIKKDKSKIDASGNIGDILNEVAAIVKVVYLETKKQNEEAADKFKRTLQAAMIDPKSPIFKE